MPAPQSILYSILRASFRAPVCGRPRRSVLVNKYTWCRPKISLKHQRGHFSLTQSVALYRIWGRHSEEQGYTAKKILQETSVQNISVVCDGAAVWCVLWYSALWGVLSKFFMVWYVFLHLQTILYHSPRRHVVYPPYRFNSLLLYLSRILVDAHRSGRRVLAFRVLASHSQYIVSISRYFESHTCFGAIISVGSSLTHGGPIYATHLQLSTVPYTCVWSLIKNLNIRH